MAAVITAVFVHGTGVREQAYRPLLARVTKSLSALGAVTTEACYWGHLGSDLHHRGASIPSYNSTRSIGRPVAVDDDEYLVALWGLLYDDPLSELRALALRRGPVGERPMGQAAPGAALAMQARTFQVSPELRDLLQQGGIDTVFQDARLAVTGSSAFRGALDAASASLAEERGAIARALIAASLALAAQEGIFAPARVDAKLRLQIESALIDALGGRERSIAGWVKGQFGDLVSRLGSRYVAQRRGAITDAAYPAAGDILLYQARGQSIADFIRQRIQEASRPRIVVAHSLGGIACVDLLCEKPIEIDLLVTVGSQAPFLYEIGALHSLGHADPLPQHFPRWLNIYDLRDFLSYIGADVFGGRVTDVKVDNGQPFPEAHSAYWYNDAVWEAIKGALP